ncbi:MAG: R3H domain-containing nucleic acid-binding protein [Patescibacteria group bacterium]
MEQTTEKIKKFFNMLGYQDFELSADPENRRVSILINEPMPFQNDMPKILPSIERLVNLMIKKEGGEPIILDVNNYRRERERLIVELAKAAAHKAAMNKTSIELPPMNAYERRLIHTEIAHKPDLKSESIGEGAERRVVVRLIEV